MGEIISKRDVANDYASNIADAASALDFPWLNGVDDDNTLAESGVYNSYHSLKSSIETLESDLQADAENLKAAAICFEEVEREDVKSTIDQIGNFVQGFIVEK